MLLASSFWVAPNATSNSYSYASPGSLNTLLNNADNSGTLKSALASGDVTVYLEGSPNITHDTSDAPDSPANYNSNVYALTSTLNLNQTTIGSSAHNLTIRAAPGAQPIISGGLPLTGWQPSNTLPYPGVVSWPGTYVTQVPYQSQINGYPIFRDLYVNGQRAVRARTPDLPMGSNSYNNSSYSTFLNPANPAAGDLFDVFNGGNGTEIAESSAHGLLNGNQPGNGYANLVGSQNDAIELVLTDQFTEFHLRIASAYWTSDGNYFLKFGSTEAYAPTYLSPRRPQARPLTRSILKMR
jgi:hypothetical protein